MHALPQRRTTRLAMLAGAAAMGAALIGGPAKAAEPTTPVRTAATAVRPVPVVPSAKTRTAAQKYSSRPYRWGALGPKGKKVSRADARPGDLVILRDSAGRVHHVGIYAGSDKIYDTPTAGPGTGKHRIQSQHVEFRRVI